jgi:hypothetical protein
MPVAHSDFDTLFNGTLYSLLSWDQLTRFWDGLDKDAGWYIYALGETRPDTIADAAHVEAFVREVDSLLRREHDEEYCGIVYADDLDTPTLIKIYDPNHLGVSCGSSHHRILPGWVMSRVPPSDLSPSHLVPQSRKRWWQGLLETIGLGDAHVAK